MLKNIIKLLPEKDDLRCLFLPYVKTLFWIPKENKFNCVGIKLI